MWILKKLVVGSKGKQLPMIYTLNWHCYENIVKIKEIFFFNLRQFTTNDILSSIILSFMTYWYLSNFLDKTTKDGCSDRTGICWHCCPLCCSHCLHFDVRYQREILRRSNRRTEEASWWSIVKYVNLCNIACKVKFLLWSMM